MNPFEIAAVGMQSDLSRLNTVSQNLANANTPGYKRLIDVRAPFADLLSAQPGGEAPTPATSALQARTAVDMAAGSLRATHKPLDLVVEGGAFVEVRSAHGLAYARSGRFEVDADGWVVNGNGERLQLTGGDLRSPLPNGQLHVDELGQVFAGETSLGRLRLVRFDNPGVLQPAGHGVYRADAATSMSDAAEGTRVRAGYQEASNVQSTGEMVRLLETTRHFEAMQKVVQGYDEVLERAIRKFAEV
ncbi:flagellar hook-basal body protein [Methylibium rhizosphaerae]|uniref:flagellar hook-basal body protein n=1 Tax=Methylibium rhizosphaerae TaxID=2570323 RepID=UPI001125DB75|nr:flagellar hook basal-body protein [Methylibium rhizosphaerae]